MSSESPILIDGASGEGGGQILRTSLALSVITGKPFRITNIRANRPKPGLRRQHLTCVLAAAQICGVKAIGAEIDSREVELTPGPVIPGEYHFDVGSAGSTMLVLQTVLPPLMLADSPSVLVLKGGTHNNGAPPFDFLEKTFLPTLKRMGPQVGLELSRPGFAPRGGGEVRVEINPAELKPLELVDRGELLQVIARASVAGLSRDIADREVQVVRRVLKLRPEQLVIDELPAQFGPGNIVSIEIQSRHITEVFTAFGQRGTRAEDVARDAARQAKTYLETNVPVGEHLADQLLLPQALARSGRFVTGELSLHATTNIETIKRFLNTTFETREIGRRRVEVVLS